MPHARCEQKAAATMAERLSFEQRKAVLEYIFWTPLYCCLHVYRLLISGVQKNVLQYSLALLKMYCIRIVNYTSFGSKDIDYQRVSTFFWTPLYI
jgi:hypothetical protein